MNKRITVVFEGGGLSGRTFSSSNPDEMPSACLCWRLTDGGSVGRQFTIRASDPVPTPFQRHPACAEEEVYEVRLSLDWGDEVTVFVRHA